MVKPIQAVRRVSWPLAVLLLAAFLRLVRLATVPFGWHPDEATKVLLARDVLAGKYFPAFFSAFTGREALFVYLEALGLLLIGDEIFMGRLLSAFVGIATVALTYATVRELFDRTTAVLAAAFLATSLWHLIASRNGYRAVIQPMIQLPVIWLLFVGLRSDAAGWRKWRPFVAAGIFLGLSQYTYTAVRVFPFLIVGIVGLVLLFDRTRFRAGFAPLVGTAVVALLVFLPLGWHFYQNPLDFSGRAAQISVFSAEWSGGDTAARLWQSVKETARMWTVWGDINYRFNISGQPVFGWLDGVLFFIGIPLSIWLGVRGRGLRRVAFFALPLWLLIMLVPMMLSAESLPYFQRAIGTLPAVYVFPALTLATGFEWATHGRGARVRLALTMVLVVLFGWLAVRTYGDYFQRWHGVARNDDDRRVAMVYVADYLAQADVRGDLYVSTQYVQHPTLALLVPERYDGIHWFDAQQALPLPSPGAEATYVLLTENAPQPWLTARAGWEQVEAAADRFGRPVFDVYGWNAGAYPTPSDRTPPTWSPATTFDPQTLAATQTAVDLPVNFGDVIQFMGHDRGAYNLAPGAVLELVLHWQTLQKPPEQYTFFVHLLSPDGQVIAGHDRNDYPTSFWRAEGDEWLMSYAALSIPPETPPGDYQLEIGVYNQPTGARLPVLVDGEPVADRLLLAPLGVR